MAQLVIKQRTKRFSGIGQYGTLFAILALIAVFGVTNDQFLTYANFSDIIKSVSIVSLLALGVTFSLIVGGFDLSVGSTASLATIGAASSLVLHSQELLVALLVPIVLGVLVGLLNALVTIKFRLPDLLATLAIMYVINGVQLTYTKGFSIYDNMPIEGGTAPGRFIPSFLFIGQGSIGPVPFVAILMILFFAGAHLFLTYSKTGREFYYVGSNVEAARRSGIAITRIKLYAYVLSGLFAAIGGIILASRIGTGQVSAGAPLLMDAVAAAYIGYAVFGTGRPNVVGTLIGAILIGILLNGLTMWDVPYYAQDIVKGTILIAALGLSYIQKKQLT